MTSKVHVTADQLQGILDALASGTIVGDLPEGFTPGSGGVQPTAPTDGLFDAFNRVDRGDGQLGTTDFGGLPYSYGPGTPQWTIGLDQRAKMAPGGARALLNLSNVNQHVRLTVNVTRGVNGAGFNVSLRESSDGTKDHYTAHVFYNANSGTHNVIWYHVHADGTTDTIATADLGVSLADAVDHILDLDLNVYSLVIAVDRTPKVLLLDTNQYVSAGTYFGFEQDEAMMAFDNISVLPQMLYDVLGPDPRRSTLNSGSYGTASFDGGYGAYTKVGGNPTNYYGNGVEAFVNTPTAAIIDLGASRDLEIGIFYDAQSSIYVGTYLRYIDEQNWLRAAEISNEWNLSVCVNGTITTLMHTSLNNGYRGTLISWIYDDVVSFRFLTLATGNAVTVGSYTLQSGDVPQQILDATKVGWVLLGGSNYCVVDYWWVFAL